MVYEAQRRRDQNDASKRRTVEEYIQSFPKDIRVKLETIRRTVRNAVPEAEEAISYQMPAYKYHGRLLYFAAFKNHISLFPTGNQAVREKFEKELSKYEGAKGTIRFPLDKPVPTRLVRNIARFRAKENAERAKKLQTR